MQQKEAGGGRAAMGRNGLQKQLIRQFYRGNIPAFVLAVAAALAAGSLNIILSWIIQQLIDAASGIPGARSLAELAKISGGLVALCVALSLLKYAAQPRFIARAMRQYKDFAFHKLMEKSIASFRGESIAAYLSALSNDASSIEADYLTQQLALITKAVTFAGAIALMLWYSPLLTAIAVGVTALPFAASVLTGGRVQSAERRVSDRSRDFTAALSDCLAGFPVVKTFRAEREIFRLFSQSNRALEREKFGRQRVRILVGMIGSVTGVFAQLGVFLIGAYLALTGRALTAGAVVLFVNLMNFLIEPVAELPGLIAARRAAVGLIGKLADALEQDDAPAGSVRLERVDHGIRLENVSFSYDGEKEILHGLSAEFEAGRAYAVVGASGGGLSGGEKQRISIARSLLKKSSVLLADEATAALDAETAHQVTSDLLDLSGVTRIIVTHTLSEALLRRCDGILVLKNSRIDETGRFDELMEKKGYFYALFTVAQ